MKRKRLLTILIAVTALFSTAGCGMEVKEEGKSLYETVKQVDDSTIRPEHADDLFQYSYAKNYEETKKGSGFTDVDVYNDGSGWGQNHSQFKDFTMDRVTDFIWESPVELGDACFYRGKQPVRFVLRDYRWKWNQQLTVFYDGESQPTEVSAIDKNRMVALADKKTPYPDGGYYEVCETDYSIACTYAVENEKEKGYERILILKENGLCCHFSYLEKNENYEDDRAKRIINSINFWNYIPAEES